MIGHLRSITQIDALIQAGLGRNINKLDWYREVMLDPRSGFYNVNYRDYAVEIFNNLLDYVLNDMALYHRLRTDLLSDNRHRRIFESIEFDDYQPFAKKMGVYLKVKQGKQREGWYVSELSKGAGAPVNAGSKALKELLRRADDAKQDVFLVPVPAREPKKNKQKLIRYYQRHGFEYEEDTGQMVRRPNVSRTVTKLVREAYVND
jgi:hypothetical protein